MFSSPQITVYSADVRRSLDFYLSLGFAETFRYAPGGEPVHVEIVLDHFTLGIADATAAREDHGLDPVPGGRGVEVVVWCEDADEAFARLTAAGAPALSDPHDWLEDLRLAWVADPDGNPVQLVANRSRPGAEAS